MSKTKSIKDGYRHCSNETVHYKYNETVIFAVLDVQLCRL